MVTCNLAKVDMRVRFSLPAPLRYTMNSEDLHIFPTLVRKIENFISDIEIKSIIDNCKKIKYKPHNALSGNAVSSHFVNDMTEQGLGNLITNNIVIDKLNLAIDEYRKEYGCIPLKVENAWINIQNKGSTLNFHTHSDSIFSGAIYLSVDNNSSNLCFINPNPYSDFLSYFCAPETSTFINYRTIYVRPKNGDLFLFPSWLKHGSHDINQTEERIVLSFNTAYNKIL